MPYEWLVGTCITLLFALVGTLWKAATTVAEIRKDVAEQGKAVAKLESGFPPALTRIAVLEEKGKSTDRFKAVRSGSKPNIDPNDD